MPRGYERSEEGHKSAALWALEVSVCNYTEESLLEPTDRGNFALEYLRMVTDITEAQADMFARYA